MVDRHPLKSIVNLGSASVDNVSSGWQSTMSSRKECNIYIMSHGFYKGYSREGDIQKIHMRETYARTVRIETPMADVAAFLATS